jgi:outer membrane protein OmpA-like peptidoglycan-associated protein
MIMAEIDVKEKKKGSLLPWLLLALGAIALIFFLTRDKGDDNRSAVATADDGTTSLRNSTSNAANGAQGWWNDIDWNAPAARHNEITGQNINVRGNDKYSIYGLGEEVLFDKGSASLKSGATQELQQVVASIRQRYEQGQIRVFGYTDATGGAQQNQQLSQQRAEAVRNWLVQTGGLNNANVTVHAQGENDPAASNNTEQGRQQNRRVEIVAHKGQ